MMLLPAVRRAILHAQYVFLFGLLCLLNGLIYAPAPARADLGAAVEGAFLTRFERGPDAGLAPGTPFPEGFAEGWDISEYTVADDHHYQTAWARSSVRYAATGLGSGSGTGSSKAPLELVLQPAPVGADKPFLGGELQRRAYSHYGHYEVKMTAARGRGVISSFFTYTGPYFGDPHDEIDFEFLGRDTRKVWINRFASGARLPGQWLDLGFDAAAGPHIYRIDWLPDRVIWSADGRELLRIEARDHAIPKSPSRIYINIWTGGPAQRRWLGRIARNTDAVAQYHCISYRPLGAAGPSCSDQPSQASDD